MKYRIRWYGLPHNFDFGAEDANWDDIDDRAKMVDSLDEAEMQVSLHHGEQPVLDVAPHTHDWQFVDQSHSHNEQRYCCPVCHGQLSTFHGASDDGITAAYKEQLNFAPLGEQYHERGG